MKAHDADESLSGPSLAPQAPRHLGLWATLAAILGGSLAYAAGYAAIAYVAAGGLAAVFLRIALIDFKLRVIPNRDAAFLLLLGWIWILESSVTPIEDLALACARSAGYAMVFRLIRFLFKQIRGREGIGAGDIKLVGACGPTLVIDNFGYAMVLASIGGIIFVYARAFIRGRKLSYYNYIPLGSFLSLSICTLWFFSLLHS